MTTDFHGAKAAVFLGDDLLVYQRDDHVVWPQHWDFPGGGREGHETPAQCLRREIAEEFGLTVADSDIVWSRPFPAMKDPAAIAYFFVVMLPASRVADVRFGHEGQRWGLMPPCDVAQLPNVVPGLIDRMTLWLRETGRNPI